MATINLSDEDYERLKRAAEEQGRTPAELVSSYVQTLTLPGEELSPLGRSFVERIDRLVAEGKIPDADPNLDKGDWVDEALAKDYYARYYEQVCRCDDS